VDGVVARLDPTDLGVCAHLQRKLQTLSTEPQPHASRRTGLCEAGKDRADRRHDGRWTGSLSLLIAGCVNPCPKAALLGRTRPQRPIVHVGLLIGAEFSKVEWAVGLLEPSRGELEVLAQLLPLLRGEKIMEPNSYRCSISKNGTHLQLFLSKVIAKAPLIEYVMRCYV
jgi:hypothetical protein